MENKQRVFIRGNKDRGEEVIKTLEDRGGKNCHVDGADPECLYFIDHEGLVSLAIIDSEFGKIIMDNYTELHLPEKWKDGDVLVSGEGLFFVLKGDFQAGDKDATIGAYCCVSEHQVCLSGHLGQIDYPHLASSKEVEHFHELMHKYGKDWDAKKKQVVGWRWEPKCGESYFYITSLGEVKESILDQDGVKTLLDFGNYFRTKEEAEVMAEKIKKLLKGE